MKNKIEILSPAGNLEILKNAINSGADSVYFGAKEFNARRNAMNFEKEDIIEAVKFAHLRGARTYLTLNTIIFDEEYQKAVEEIKFATKAGIDAIIVQDPGMLSLIRKVSPEMEVHASTQMSAHSVSDVLALEEMGFSRVVVARELSKDEIINIKKNTSAEIETFIHGAHCMSVSGQCYFSSALGERSGNRGLCAQVCRLPFKGNDKNDYSLSLKDMSLIDRLHKMEDAGISTVKIEGRMKNTSYVNCVTKAVYDKREHDTYDKESIRNIFSRSGFTDGYFAGKLGKDMFGVRSEEDKSNSKEAAKLYANVENMQRISLDLRISVIEGEPLKLYAVDIDGNEAYAEGEIVQTAKNKPVDKTFVTDKLTKLGSTVYLPGKVNVELSGSPFVSAAAINSVRREVCEKLDAIRMAIKPRKIIDYVPPKASKKEKLNAETLFYSRLQSISQLNEKIYDLSDKVIIPLYDIENTEGKYIADDKIIVEIPRVYFGDEEKIKDCLNKAKSMGITKAMAHTVGRVKLAKDAGMEVLGGFGLNISNSLSVECMKDMGVNECILSIELNLNQMKNSRGIIPAGILAYGKIPVMITRNCPSFTFCKDGKKGGCSITDRKGIDFEVVCGNGVSEILNSAPIYLGDKPEDIEKADFALLHFTTETQEQIESILKDYRQIKKNPPSNFTRGCYKRKVE